MAKIKAKDLRSLSIDELNDKAEALRKERFESRLQAKFGKLEDVTKPKKLRKEIARIMTVKQELKKNG